MSANDEAYDRLHGLDGHVQNMKCDYCGQPGISLAGETNGVLVCIDHAERGLASPTPHESIAIALAEAEWLLRNAIEARDRAERQAEALDAELTLLRSAADKVGHQAACPVDPCDCWMRDLALLLDDKQRPDTNEAECSGLCGEHHWLDRPESDTRECLICGTEATG